MQGGPKSKPLPEFLLNRIENTSMRLELFFVKFECKRSTDMLSLGTTCSVCDLIRDDKYSYAVDQGGRKP